MVNVTPAGSTGSIGTTGSGDPICSAGNPKSLLVSGSLDWTVIVSTPSGTANVSTVFVPEKLVAAATSAKLS